MFQDYLLGVNGSCDFYEIDRSSYWSAVHASAVFTECMQVPAKRPHRRVHLLRALPARAWMRSARFGNYLSQGMNYDESALPNAPYSDVSDAVISAWRGSHVSHVSSCDGAQATAPGLPVLR